MKNNMQDFKLDGMNIEVTDFCPLRCPQCYCHLEGKRYIPLEVAKKHISDAAKMGVEHIEFSGGETLCYPHIYEVIRFACENGISTGISISGWGFDQAVFEKLCKSGIDSIHVSLNAPTEELNALSRDGFELAMNALDILKKGGFQNTIINWVMHRNTVETLPEMIKLAEEFNAQAILIIDPKPNAANELDSYPTKQQMMYVADLIRRNKSNVELVVHHCFSALAALSSENKLWGNMNRGLYKGCTAGLCSISIRADGSMSPCRHLDFLESYDSLEAYWNNSDIIKQIQKTENEKRQPCKGCKYENYCRHCLAINAKLKNELFIGNEFCPIQENAK